MKVITEITKNTYELTFNSEADYEWSQIGKLFIDSNAVYEDLTDKDLINKNELKEDVLYWQDLFFMEAVEQSDNLNNNDPLIKQLKANPLFISNIKFINHLPKATVALGREILIDELIDNKNADQLIPDKLIEAALKKKSRDDLKRYFEKWNAEDEIKTKKLNSKRFFYRKYIAIAAIFFIGLVLWQPNKMSDNEIIEEFAYNDKVFENILNEGILKSKLNSGLRGQEYNFKGLTARESKKAKEAIYLVGSQEMLAAKEKLLNLDIENKSNNQLLFFLAISQAYSGDEKKALDNLIELKKIENFLLLEDVNFQLAMLFIRINKRGEGKKLLNSIAREPGKYQSESEKILRKMKWF
jgi:murein DD-endopeptidase MepM/ murein hydrolase activator NlpD